MNATGDSTGENFPPGQSSPFLQGRRGLPRWLTGKEFAYSAGDTGSLPGPGRSPGEGNGNPLQYSQLENPMHREAWWVTVHWGTRVGHNLETATATAKSLQSCPILCDAIDGSPPGSPVPGILLARTLEWVAIPFSNA